MVSVNAIRILRGKAHATIPTLFELFHDKRYSEYQFTIVAVLTDICSLGDEGWDLLCLYLADKRNNERVFVANAICEIYSKSQYKENISQNSLKVLQDITIDQNEIINTTVRDILSDFN